MVRGAEVQRCRGAGVVQSCSCVDVQMWCRGVVHMWCRGAEQVHRCRGSEVQRFRGSEVQRGRGAEGQVHGSGARCTGGVTEVQSSKRFIGIAEQEYRCAGGDVKMMVLLLEDDSRLSRYF